ncbi:hypothetical protein PAECIP111893_02620 [Paenibacillus plantiphilus]|uniref:DUF2569 domain-containing protein n=1 Tax=Paenibacillus plantiphilus TaxID=2905650 RepID=A0ABN8GGH6_9BACL|nr:DUF2569 family protein [Paenibacillus plantiphilus]CAH1206811.1 hypothetical protein PAECIP111893_02620 [Paenibacillus plantiphilus]
MDITKQPDKTEEPASQLEEQSDSQTDSQSEEKDFYYKHLHLKGLGGWLIIVHISMWLFLLNACVNVVFVTLPKILQFSKYTDPASSMYDVKWSFLIPLQFIGNLLIVLTLLILLFKFVSRSSTFPKWFISFNIGLTAFYILDFAINLFFPMNDENLFIYISAVMRQGLLCLLWIGYMLRSKRVKVTFRW